LSVSSLSQFFNQPYRIQRGWIKDWNWNCLCLCHCPEGQVGTVIQESPSFLIRITNRRSHLFLGSLWDPVRVGTWKVLKPKGNNRYLFLLLYTSLLSLLLYLQVSVIYFPLFPFTTGSIRTHRIFYIWILYLYFI
jgi:hypothetical protein